MFGADFLSPKSSKSYFQKEFAHKMCGNRNCPLSFSFYGFMRYVFFLLMPLSVLRMCVLCLCVLCVLCVLCLCVLLRFPKVAVSTSRHTSFSSDAVVVCTNRNSYPPVCLFFPLQHALMFPLCNCNSRCASVTRPVWPISVSKRQLKKISTQRTNTRSSLPIKNVTHNVDRNRTSQKKTLFFFCPSSNKPR